MKTCPAVASPFCEATIVALPFNVPSTLRFPFSTYITPLGASAFNETVFSVV